MRESPGTPEALAREIQDSRRASDSAVRTRGSPGDQAEKRRPNMLACTLANLAGLEAQQAASGSAEHPHSFGDGPTDERAAASRLRSIAIHELGVRSPGSVFLHRELHWVATVALQGFVHLAHRLFLAAGVPQPVSFAIVG